MMRTRTWTFMTGAAVGYYLGSRPGAQAMAEVRHASTVGLEFVRTRVRHLLASRHSTAAETQWTDLDSDAVLYPPAFDVDFAHQEEALDEIGRESFPSSDPPSTWAGADDAFPRGARP